MSHLNVISKLPALREQCCTFGFEGIPRPSILIVTVNVVRLQKIAVDLIKKFLSQPVLFRIHTGSKLPVLWDDGLEVVIKVGIRDFIVKDEVGFDKFIGHGQKIG